MVIIGASIWMEFFRGKSMFLDKVTVLLEENQVYAIE